jgi:hypothetical protein
MSWSNPFANSGGGTGLTATEVQGIIDELSISPIYTSQATAQKNLLNYEIVRVNLASNEILLPSNPANGLHIRIKNEKMGNLLVKGASGAVIATMYYEICSFYYTDNQWVTINSY